MAAWYEQYIEAWNRHSGADVAACTTEDVVFVDLAVGETFHGRAGVAGWVDAATQTLSSDYRFELTNAVATETDYALEWTMSGTHDRSGPQQPATGKAFRVLGASVGRLRGGKIAENRDYWNMADFLGQVGLMPTAAGAHG
jgi:steroid delta-isomerase-like uncharacterized protein